MKYFDTNGFAMVTDLYELTMAQVYFQKNMNKEAVFDFYIRPTQKRPYFVMAGVEELVFGIKNFRFTSQSIAYLRSLGKFDDAFLGYLENFRFNGDIWAVEEGEIVFANEPLVKVQAPLIEAQIIETLLINTLQLPILVATKAARCVSVAGDTKLVDFGLRRAHGIDAGVKAARSAYIAGFLGTSNILAGELYNIPVFGTMAHSFVMVYKSEKEAFEDFVAAYPDNAILLVDTYDSIEGIKNAIEVVRSKGLKHFKGIRLDSGDIVELAKQAREMLDSAGLRDAIILVSGGLDEYKIEELLTQGAPIDAWGVGTKLVVSDDLPYLDCAYKLVQYDSEPKMKFSPHKSTFPGNKQIYRYYKDGFIEKDVVELQKNSTAHTLLQQVMYRGEVCNDLPTAAKIREKFFKNFAALPPFLRNIHTNEPFLPEIGENLQRLMERFYIKFTTPSDTRTFFH